MEACDSIAKGSLANRLRTSNQTSTASAFKQTAAGHAALGVGAILEEVDDVGQTPTILKELDEAEWMLYKEVAEYAEDPVQEVVPVFHGVVERLAADGVSVMKYLRMANVLHSFSRPTVVDVKIGIRTHLEAECENPKLRSDLYTRMVELYPWELNEADHAKKGITKAKWMGARDSNTTIGTLGFRIDGIAGDGGSPSLVKELKKSVKSVTDQAAAATFFQRFIELAAMDPESHEYFVSPSCIARQLRNQLAHVLSALESSLFVRRHEFIGTSILLVADRFGRSGVFWIDFAKSTSVPNGMQLTHRAKWVMGNHEDGIIQGIEKMLETLGQVSSSLQEEEENGVKGTRARRRFCSADAWPGCFAGAMRWMGSCGSSSQIAWRPSTTTSSVEAASTLSDLSCFLGVQPHVAGGTPTKAIGDNGVGAGEDSLAAGQARWSAATYHVGGAASSGPGTVPDDRPVSIESSAANDELKDFPDVSRLGCSLAFLQEFSRSSVTSSTDMRKLHEEVVQRTRVRRSLLKKLRLVSEQERKRFCLRMPGEYVLPDGIDGEAEGTGNSDDEVTFSYSELGTLLSVKDALGNPAFAKATHFVSYASEYSFNNILDALGYWLSRSGIPEEEAYFWMDITALNHHEVDKYPPQWYTTRMMQAIANIGNTVLVVEPWNNPVALRRSWIIWEMYCTITTGARLHFAMNPKSHEHFSLALLDSYEEVQTALSQVDVSRCRAFFPQDQEMIHGEIQRTVGFTRMNEMIQTRITEWLLTTMKEQVVNHEAAAIRSASGATSCWSGKERRGGLELRVYFRLKGNLGRMLRESGRSAQAEDVFWELQAQTERHFGRNDAASLSCLNQLAVTLQKQSKREQALTIHQECLKRRTKVLGQMHEDTLQSASNLAVLLSTTQPLAEENFSRAREFYIMALTGREATLGPNHPRTLYTASNFGCLLSFAPKGWRSSALMEEAEVLHHRAVRDLTQSLHAGHPLTLTAMHSQACHWLERGHFESNPALNASGVAQLNAVLTARTEKLGSEHPDTLTTAEALKVERSRTLKASGGSRQCLTQSDFEGTKWPELVLAEFPEVHTAAQFREMRALIRDFGAQRLRGELVADGFVDDESDFLTVGMQPFNVFARIAAGLTRQASMAEAQARLGAFQDRYAVACNRPECDEQWANDSPAWVGKASMSRAHALLLVKDLHWEWFNVLTYGLVSGLDAAVSRLEEMREAALLWTSFGDGWPKAGSVGLFFHVHPHCSVKSSHLHIVDMDHLGPTFNKLAFKNLSIDDALLVLREELEAEGAAEQGAVVVNGVSAGSKRVADT